LKYLIPAGVFALLVVVLAIGIQRAPSKNVIPSALIGKPAPAWSLPVIASKQSPLPATFDAAQLRGRWFVFNVWGTWCPECKVEHSMLLEMARQNKLPLIGLDWKDDDAAARRWLESLGDPYDVVVADRDGRTAIDFGVYGAPETFLIDDRGIVVYKHVGAMNPDVWQREFLARLPATGAAAEANTLQQGRP
jgi:cytochrome c biogenesis protein CcmG, thiol:disulfide interchange protein DsbE